MCYGCLRKLLQFPSCPKELGYSSNLLCALLEVFPFWGPGPLNLQNPALQRQKGTDSKNKTTTKTQNSNKADVFYLWLLNTGILPQGIAMYLKAFDSKSILGPRRRASILGAYQLWAGTANCTFVQPIINSLTIHFWVVENMIKPSEVGLFLCLLFCKKDPLVTP